MKLASIKTLGLALGAAVTLGVASPVQAQSADALLDLLVQKGVINQREANDVRSQLDQQTSAAVEAYSKSKVSNFLDNLKMSGDLRLRGEFFDNEDQSSSVDRWRFRYRLRLQIEAQLPEWARIGVRLASGDGDPVSTNQTLSDTFRKKPITVDAAYVKLQVPGWDWISVSAGKIDNPIWQPSFNSPMVYDGDLTPEGVAEQLNFKFGEHRQHRVFGNFGQYAVKEFSSDANDAGLFDLQGGIEARFGGSDVAKSPRFRVVASGGYFLTHNLENALYAGSFDSPNLGNATVNVGGSTNRFLADFQVVYLRGEAGWQMRERPVLGTPALLTLSGEYVKNLTGSYQDLADDQTEGWTAQVAFGSARKKGQWQVAYQYKHLEADAVWDAVTDSDWGNGGTDRKGHVIKASYNVQDWWQLGVGAFITEKISNRPNSGHNTRGSIGAADEQLLRVQLDSSFKF